MRVAVIGEGGREHAIIKKLLENTAIETLFALPGNDGIAQHATCVPISTTDVTGITRFAVDNALDFVAIIPDDPLCMGLSDLLEKAGIKVFGPSKKAAQIEGSKIFAKKLMTQYGIPTADFKAFSDPDSALQYLQTIAFPTVIKADGLARGKGVVICASYQEAKEAVHDIMNNRRFGIAGSRILIESFLSGAEVSVLCFTDGQTLIPMPAVMDHKRVFDDDQGLNTGGMGAIAPNPFYTDELAAQCMKDIFMPTINALYREGRPFKGCLYFGLILTDKGPKVIEYNCRFGDPETQAVLPLLQSDLLDIMLAVSNNKLDGIPVVFSTQSSCCIVLTSGGYPGSFTVGHHIHGLHKVHETTLCYAGIKRDPKGDFITAGGRVINITHVASTLREAVAGAYRLSEEITFHNCHMRTDIGQRALQGI